jgi:tetratricopeptide (TPR) repeat protein
MTNRLAIMLAAAATAFLSAPVLAAGSGGGGLPATSAKSVDPAEAFRDGVAALQENDYKKAEKKFGDVLSVAPKHPEANYYMALAKIGNGKPKNAVRYLEKAIAARSNFVEAREKLALVSIELGEAAPAREQLTAIEALKTECAEAGDCEPDFVARVDLAIERVNAALNPAAPAGAGSDSAAIDEETSSDTEIDDENNDGEDAGSDAPDDEQASLFFAPRGEGVTQYMAAVRLINEGRYEAAISDLDKAAAIVGPHPDILNYLGYSNRKLGRMDMARDYYAQALALDPDHRGANEYLGELYLEIGDIDRAKRQLARLDSICDYGCAEREDLARLIDRREGAVAER